MSKPEIDIELTAACNKLRIMIRNEQLEKDYADAWHKLSQTSTIKRRIKNETGNIQVIIQNN